MDLYLVLKMFDDFDCFIPFAKLFLSQTAFEKQFFENDSL